MKNRKLFSIIIKLSLACALLLALPSCNGKENSVIIQDMPERCVYYIGEVPDISGASILVTENGESKTVTVTEEMLGLEKDTPFSRAGKNVITVTYNGTPLKLELFVDDNLENHKNHALTSLSLWAEENTVCDSVSDAIIKNAKESILNAQNHNAIVTACEKAKKLALDYTGKIKAANALLFAKDEAFKAFSSFDFSIFTKDHAEDIKVYISEYILLIENASTPEEVEIYYSGFVSKTEELKNDSSNELIFELEKSFKEKYEDNRIYYHDDEYEILTASLIETERSVRKCVSDDEAKALIKEFSEQTAPKFNTIPDIIYKKLSLLSEDSLKYDTDFTAIDEIADTILALLLKSESDSVQFLKDKPNKTAIYELAAAENNDSIKYYPALANYQTEDGTVNLISKTEALYRACDNLEEASKAAKSVIDTINAIGSVRLDSQSKITAARKAYSEWSKKYSIEQRLYDIQLRNA